MVVVLDNTALCLATILAHMATKLNKLIKRKQEEHSRKNIEKHVVCRRSLISCLVLLDHMENAANLLLKLL